jgi:tetratricopeptide (TPR) repeat protein
MLGGVDARQMGKRLEADLSERVADAHRESSATPTEVAAARTSFQGQIAKINSTDAALRVIDENILSQAIATSGTQFADRPLIRAQLLQSIGQTYSKLGLLDRAEPPLLRAIALDDSVGRPGATQALASMRQLANVYSAQGRSGAAESLFKATLEGQRRSLGPQDPEVLQTMDDMAVLYTDNERYAEAESLYRIVLPAMRRTKGAEDPRTLACLSNYAWTLISQDKFAEAESLAVLAVRLKRKVLGNENKETMDSANNLAVLYVRSGRPELALPLYLEDYDTSRKLLGDEHPDVLVSMTNLGRLYNRMKRFPEAEAILRRSVATTRKVMPPGFIGLGITLLAHSEALVGLGRDREAEPDAMEAYGILRGLRGEHDPGAQRAVHVLVSVYEKTGRPALAAKWRGKLVQEPRS